MPSPYDILAVSESASDSEIKQAYLDKVKLNPPEKSQEKFQQLHSAYETIKNQGCREHYALFHYTAVDFDTLLKQAFMAGPLSSLTGGQFQTLLSLGIHGGTFHLTRHKHHE